MVIQYVRPYLHTKKALSGTVIHLRLKHTNAIARVTSRVTSRRFFTHTIRSLQNIPARRRTQARLGNTIIFKTAKTPTHARTVPDCLRRDNNLKQSVR